MFCSTPPVSLPTLLVHDSFQLQTMIIEMLQNTVYTVTILVMFLHAQEGAAFTVVQIVALSLKAISVDVTIYCRCSETPNNDVNVVFL